MDTPVAFQPHALNRGSVLVREADLLEAFRARMRDTTATLPAICETPAANRKRSALRP